MTWKKKLFIAVMLVLVGLGLWFYYALFVSTGAAVQHAEAFRFRRMAVAQPGVQDAYRYLFVTNRESSVEDAPIEDRFGRNRAPDLNFGSFTARIEPTLGLGMLIDPSQWFQDEEIRIEQLQLLDRADFVAQLRELVEKSPRRSLLLVVHGFREAFPSALRKTAFLGHVLDINSPVLLFDWPGDQGASPLGYQRARRVAEESGAELAQTIKLVIEEVAPERLWLLANSMGGQVIVDAFSLLYEDPALADAATEIEDVVLTAPDVDHEEFNERFKQEITALADHLTVYVSSNDRALLMSRIINRSNRLGESTLSPNQFEEAARIVDLVEPDNDLITLVDVTPVNRTRNFHNFSLETPEFFDDLYLRLTTEGVVETRPIYQLRTPDGAIYWVLTRGR